MSTPMYDPPEHLLIGVNEIDLVPKDEDRAVRFICWCVLGADCPTFTPREKRDS